MYLKTIRINKESYDYITEKAKRDKRTIIATIDMIIESYRSIGETFNAKRSKNKSTKKKQDIC